MSKEIERKFLLAEEPVGMLQSRRYAIQQGYLVDGYRREIRVRRRNKECFLTIKDGAGLSRGETEISITSVQFDRLWPLTEGHRIEKDRYLLPWENLTIEIDIYLGALSSLRVAEIEFKTVAESEKFVKPPFLGTEVTGLAEYSNAALASQGMPGNSGQIGCVPFIRKGRDLHILLVRNSSGQRWIVPKGQSEDGMTPTEVALMEAVEEGGAVGHIESSLQSRCQLEDGRTLRLYALKVSSVLKRWPEAGFRKRTILPWAEAVASIEDKSLAACVDDLARRFLGEI